MNLKGSLLCMYRVHKDAWVLLYYTYRVHGWYCTVRIGCMGGTVLYV